MNGCVQGRHIKRLEQDLSSRVAVLSRVQRRFGEEYWVLATVIVSAIPLYNSKTAASAIAALTSSLTVRRPSV